MEYLPLQIPIKNKKCVVIGAGKVSLKRTRRLLNCGAEVLVVSPKIGDAFQSLEGNLTVIEDKYKREYIENAFIVAACTGDKRVNKEIYEDGLEIGAIVYTADEMRPESVVFPAVIERESVIVSLSSTGSYPLLTRYLKDEIESVIPDFMDEKFIKRLSKYRREMIENIPDEEERKKKLKDFLNNLIAAGEKHE